MFKMLKCLIQILGTKKRTKLEINKPPKLFDAENIAINLDAEKIEKNFRPPETVGFWRLNDYISNLESSGFAIKTRNL